MCQRHKPIIISVHILLEIMEFNFLKTFWGA